MKVNRYNIHSFLEESFIEENGLSIDRHYIIFVSGKMKIMTNHPDGDFECNL